MAIVTRTSTMKVVIPSVQVNGVQSFAIVFPAIRDNIRIRKIGYSFSAIYVDAADLTTSHEVDCLARFSVADDGFNDNSQQVAGGLVVTNMPREIWLMRDKDLILTGNTCIVQSGKEVNFTGAIQWNYTGNGDIHVYITVYWEGESG